MDNFTYDWMEAEDSYCIFDGYDDPIMEVLEFLQSERDRNVSLNDQENKAVALRHWFEYLWHKNDLHFSHAKTENIPDFISWLKTSPEFRDMHNNILKQKQYLESSTIMQYISRISVFYDLYVFLKYPNCSIVWKEDINRLYAEYIQKNEHKFKEKFDTYEPDSRSIPVNIFKEIRDHTTNDRNHLLLTLIYITGLRRGEVGNIDMRQFDIVDRSIPTFKMTVHDSFESRKDKQTKTGGRHVYIPSSFAEKIGAYIEHHRCSNKNKHYQIFTAIKKVGNTKVGDPLTGVWISKIFSNAAKAAGYQDYSIHDCRHSAVTNMLSIGTDISTVADQVGHDSIQTTQKYRSKISEDLKAIIDYCNILTEVIKD